MCFSCSLVKLYCAHPTSPGQKSETPNLLLAGRTGLREHKSCCAASWLGDSGQLLREPSGKDGGVAQKRGRLEPSTL